MSHYRPRASDPIAAGQCDRCGFIYRRTRLAKQMAYRGNALAWTGWLVCGRCLDVPFELDRPLRIPPDPPPVPNPRPETEIVTPLVADDGTRIVADYNITIEVGI